MKTSGKENDDSNWRETICYLQKNTSCHLKPWRPWRSGMLYASSIKRKELPTENSIYDENIPQEGRENKGVLRQNKTKEIYH